MRSESRPPQPTRGSARFNIPSLGLSPLLLLVLFAACAEAPDGELPAYGGFDAASVIATEAGVAPGQEPGEVITPYEAGPGSAGPTPGVDAGTPSGLGDTGAPKPGDTGTTPAPVDTGAPKPVDAGAPPAPAPVDAGPPKPIDAGAPPAPAPVDAGPPKPIDAGFDAGPPKPVDAGSTTPDTGASQMCAATPSYPTKTGCATCTCAKCGSQVAACYASSESAKNTQCAAVRACAESNHCAGDSCYCGTNASCLLPNGPCQAVIEQAAGSESITAAAGNLNSPLGRSKAVGACQETSCKSECGL